MSREIDGYPSWIPTYRPGADVGSYGASVGTVRAAVKDLIRLAEAVTGGEPSAEPAEHPRHRGPVWLVVQVLVAAVPLAVGLLVRQVLGEAGGAAVWWSVPALLLVAPFVAHFLFRPRRPFVGLVAVVVAVVVVVLAALEVVGVWDAWAVGGTAVVAALAAACVLGVVSPVEAS